MATLRGHLSDATRSFRTPGFDIPTSGYDIQLSLYRHLCRGFPVDQGLDVVVPDHYLGGLDVDFKDPRISPLYASDSVLVTCPPAFVLTTGYDPLQDEGLAYADKLEGNGVAVQRIHFDDQIHASTACPWKSRRTPGTGRHLQALRNELAS